MTINSTTRRTNALVGNGNTATYPFAFKVFTDADVVVKKLETATSIETTLTLGASNDYIVTLNSDQNGNPGGSITLRSGGSDQNLASGFQIVITSALTPLQGTDLTNQGGFYPEVINDALDKSVILHQQQQDELDRSIKFSLTNTIGSLEITENANARKNRVLGFDNLGEFEVLKELGTYRGNWAASTAYAVRDLVKDTSTNNIFFCNTAHTSSGSQPLTTNTNSANWDLIVDAASATTSATNAASSATAAASSATAAANSATAAATSETNAGNSATTANTHKNDAQTAKTAAETAQTAAETAKTAAETALDSFDDRYLGAKSSDPSVDNDGNALIDGALYFNTTDNVTKVYDLGNTAWVLLKLSSADQAKVNTVEASISNVNSVAGNISNVNAVAGNSANINSVAADASDIGAVAGAITNVNNVGGAIANVNTVASNISNVNTVAADIAKVVTVANDLNETVSEIETAAADLQETTSEIDTVANSITNVDLVGNNISNINALGQVLAGQTTYAVTVASGVFYIDGASAPTLNLIRGYTYIFNQADNTNNNHPLAFKDASGNAYTTGVTVNGTAGQAGANVTFVVASNAPASLRYYCTVHGNSMGNTIAVGDDNIGVVAGSIGNVNTVAGGIANVNNVGGSIANVNTVATGLSGVNAFAARYRVGSSNPTTDLNAGDLFYNTNLGKLLVYNGTTSAWEETQTIGSFFINTISQFTGTGGNSATFNGTAYKFTLSNAGAFAQQMLVSINGVVQKPNAGSGQPSEGFALDGANIVFSSPPPSGADYFIITIGSTVSIGTPSAGVINNSHIAANAAIDASKISGLSTDKINEGDSKVEVVDTGSASYVTTEVDGTEASRVLPNGNTIFTSAIFGANTSKVDGSGQGISILYGGGTSNIGVISSTDTNGLHIKQNSGVLIGQNGFPNNFYAGFYPTGVNFHVAGAVKLQVNASGVTTSLSILPSADSTHDIGTNTNRFRNVYADNYYGDGSNLTGVSSAEIYGFNTDSNGNLIVTSTNGGVDNISGTDYDNFEDVIFAATGFTFSVNANGKLIATI